MSKPRKTRSRNERLERRVTHGIMDPHGRFQTWFRAMVGGSLTFRRVHVLKLKWRTWMIAGHPEDVVDFKRKQPYGCR